MVCTFSCMLSLMFIISMIVMNNAVESSQVIQKYKDTLNVEQKRKYEEIIKERSIINYQGYALGFIFSLFIIFYNYYLKKNKLSNMSIVCIIVATSFVTQYFYYILHPKKNWMLNNIHTKIEIQNWLNTYRSMQMYYHISLVLGIIAIGILGFAFRC